MNYKGLSSLKFGDGINTKEKYVFSSILGIGKIMWKNFKNSHLWGKWKLVDETMLED